MTVLMYGPLGSADGQGSQVTGKYIKSTVAVMFTVA